MGMSGEESGRQRKRRERIQAREAAGIAYQVHPTQTPGLYRGDRLDDHAPGEHVWIISATFRTSLEEIQRQYSAANPQDPDSMMMMDRESLALVVGPGCWVCEQEYSPAMAARPCPGDPSQSVKRGERR